MNTGPVHLRVLLVDDNPHDRGIVKRELRNEFDDPRFVEVTNELEFQEALGAGEFDVVVTDFQIRWTDGLIVLEKIKGRYPDIPVLMFTATGNEEIAVAAMKAGLDDYVIKNMHHLIRLRGAVRAALTHSDTRKRAARLESRLQSLLSQLQVGSFSCTPDGRFQELNPAMQELLSRNSSDGTPVNSIHGLFAIDFQAEQFLQTVRHQQAPVQIEFEKRMPAGDFRLFRLSAHYVDQRPAPRIDGLVEDVTELRQIELQTQRAARAQARLEMLSPREKEVLDEVVSGTMNKNIARRLDISEKTVEKHRSHLMKKLDIHSVAQLVRLAMQAEQNTPTEQNTPAEQALPAESIGEPAGQR